MFSLCSLVRKKKKIQPFKIYHLKPIKVYKNTDTLRSFGWYSKKRSDSFVVKNFDKNIEVTKKQDKIKILAKLIKIAAGDKVQIAQYKIIEPIKGILTSDNDTINVGYYNYKVPKHTSGNLILKLLQYDGNSGAKTLTFFLIMMVLKEVKKQNNSTEKK